MTEAHAARLITAVDEYRGERRIRVAATQLDLRYSRTDATRIVSEWVGFLSSGPTPIEDLEFVTRTPNRLFDALEGQTQLRRLAVKWGDYADLSVLTRMRGLTTLELRGASSVRDIAPLAQLQTVAELVIESLRRVRDLSPIAAMRAVTDLDLGGDWRSPRVAHVDSLSFLRGMPQLRRLLLHTLIADDLDYSALLELPSLGAIRVMKARGMRPKYDELVAALPWVY